MTDERSPNIPRRLMFGGLLAATVAPRLPIPAALPAAATPTNVVTPVAALAPAAERLALPEIFEAMDYYSN